MNIIDFKSVDLAQLTKKFAKLDEELLSNSTLKKQKTVLKAFYASSSFTRDELLVRKLAIESKSTPQLKKLIDYYANSYISFFICALGAYLSYIFSVGFSKISWLPGLFLVVVIFAYFGFIRFQVCHDKENYYNKEIPLLEIYKIELEMLVTVLDCGKSIVNLDDLCHELFVD